MSSPVSLPVAFGSAALTIAVWAAAFPVITVALRHVDPFGLAAVRFGIAGLIMAGWLIWRRATLGGAGDVARIVACGALGIATYNILLNLGQRTVEPGAASFLVATQPIFAAGAAHLLGEQRLRWLSVGGVAVSLVGVGIISIGGGARLTASGDAALIVAAAACSGAYFTIQRPLSLKYGAGRAAAWTVVSGALLLTPWLARGAAEAFASLGTLLPVLFLSLVAVVGYVFWNIALSGLGSPRAASLSFLMAPLASLIAVPVAGIWPGPETLWGGGLALAGVVLVHRANRPPHRPLLES